MVLGGSGQGRPTSGEPATAYLGSGPWGSLGPAVPSIPAQALEGVVTLLLLAAMAAMVTMPAIRRPDGRAFLVALAGWCLVRLLVAATWRDPVVVGPLRAEQAIDVVVLAAAAILAAAIVRRTTVRTRQPSV